jgi:hypothetical protein
VLRRGRSAGHLCMLSTQHIVTIPSGGTPVPRHMKTPMLCWITMPPLPSAAGTGPAPG